MIVDTSALVAVVRKEAEFVRLLDAMLAQDSLIPAPILVELRRVTAVNRNNPDPEVDRLLRELIDGGAAIEPFTAADADRATAANERHGTGNGRGGTLNLLDLMVYGMAERRGLPILCTGRDFAATGIAIHPASRRS